MRSLFDFLTRRPAWQSRDADRRAAAVARLADAALMAALPQILRQDPDAGVRRAALERIGDVELIADRAANDSDAGLRERARARLIERMVGDAPLADRLRVLKVIEDAALIEEIARRAPEAELRRAALERVRRPGFLAERCLEDPEHTIRIWLLDRIENPGTLERLAEEARKRDKRLFKAIRERLDRERVESGESSALLDRAEALCLAIEQQLREPGPAALAVLERAHEQWREIRPRIDERFDRRFQGASDTLRSALAAIAQAGEEPVAAAAAVAPVADQQVGVPAERSEPDRALAELLRQAEELKENTPVAELDALERRWSSEWLRAGQRPAVDQPLLRAFRARLAALRQAAKLCAAAREQHRLAAEAALGELNQALAAQQLSTARAARARARQALAELDPSEAKALERRLADLEPRIEQLARWQRWSNNQVRRRLCDEVAALAGSGLHPDAIANRIAELKEQWKRIDELERDPLAPEAESGLSKRFRYLCHKALEPARPYFEKRKEVRGRRAEEVGAFIERAQAALAASDTPPAELMAIRREAGDWLRRIDEIDPKRRGEVGRQLKDLIAAASAGLNARFQAIFEEKQRLINQLRRQLAHAELAEALELVKSAQKRWQSLGRGARKSDQAQWEEFRALVDPLFAQHQESIASARAAAAAELDAAQALIDELARLATDETLDSARLAAAIENIDKHWRAAQRPSELERAYDRERERAHAHLSACQQREAQTRLDRLAALAARLDAIEAGAGDDLEACAAEAETLDSAQAAALYARIERMRKANDAIRAAEAERGEQLLLEYEYLCGIESPPEAQAARLKLQVDKLAQRMSGGQAPSPEAERERLDREWYGIGPLDPADRQRLAQRRARAVG
jgi:hypothetical protein